ncbi:MAG: glutamine--fructose-6-phosphate transaminase (isomerizing) [bacterium]
MCGIVACSSVDKGQEVVIEALSRMQYRGYDSYGFAYITEAGGLDACRSIDHFEPGLISLPDSRVLLGHTRWATHGGVSVENCHPHSDPLGRFALVHNGIVSNFDSLKASLLEQGTQFQTTTDTEVLVHLMSMALEERADRMCALMSLQKMIKGRNTLLFLFADGELLGVRQGSPLVVSEAAVGGGIEPDQRKALYVASDILAFGDQTFRSVPLLDGQIVSIKAQNLLIVDPAGNPVAPHWVETSSISHELKPVDDESSGSGYKHCMLREVLEQWRTIPAQTALDELEFQPFVEVIKGSRQVFVTGAGGASYTARQVGWLLRTIAGIKAMDVAAYDIENIHNLVEEDDVLIVLSQSGETADSLHAIQIARKWGMKIACLVNMPMSTMTRVSDFVFYNHAGPEECVLSTKSASAQIAFGYLLANTLCGNRGKAQQHIDRLSHLLSQQLVVSQLGMYQGTSAYLANQEHLFLLGRGEHFATALIGALNIKEASYLHAEAFSAGELKHGVIALIEPGIPVILFVPEGDTYMLGVANEVKARGAYVIAITDAESGGKFVDSPVDVWITMPGDGSPLSAIIPCQLLAYYVAVSRGLNPDRPRNLAKSVTVQ